MDIKFQKVEQYSSLVNFQRNVFEKVHRWFYIKEVHIEIARKIRSSSQQARLFKNGDSLKESLIIMRKV